MRVFLSFVCMITVSSRFCSRDLIAGVKHLQQEAPNKKSLYCSLYTPTIQDYENCPRTTLKCFASEMDVLIDEWEVKPTGQHLRKKLVKLAMRFSQVESGCPQCEVLKEENATTFLERLRSTLETINSQYC